MQANRKTFTKPELVLRKALWHSGVRSYRLNQKHVIGKPDLVFLATSVAVFVHGCFWHRCPHCNMHVPQKNGEFWQRKFARNQERDEMHRKALEEAGWTVVIIWECQLSRDLKTCVEIVQQAVRDAKE